MSTLLTFQRWSRIECGKTALPVEVLNLCGRAYTNNNYVIIDRGEKRLTNAGRNAPKRFRPKKTLKKTQKKPKKCM